MISGMSTLAACTDVLYQSSSAQSENMGARCHFASSKELQSRRAHFDSFTHSLDKLVQSTNQKGSAGNLFGLPCVAQEAVNTIIQVSDQPVDHCSLLKAWHSKKVLLKILRKPPNCGMGLKFSYLYPTHFR